jgi:hypothetical protein
MLSFEAHAIKSHPSTFVAFEFICKLPKVLALQACKIAVYSPKAAKFGGFPETRHFESATQLLEQRKRKSTRFQLETREPCNCHLLKTLKINVSYA